MFVKWHWIDRCLANLKSLLCNNYLFIERNSKKADSVLYIQKYLFMIENVKKKIDRKVTVNIARKKKECINGCYHQSFFI